MQLPEVISWVESIDSRVSAIERRVGTGADTSDIDREPGQVRQDKLSALATEHYEDAAVLRDRERQLLSRKASRRHEWTQAHPGLASLAEQVQQLSEQVKQLHGLLHQDGSGAADDTGAA